MFKKFDLMFFVSAVLCASVIFADKNKFVIPEKFNPENSVVFYGAFTFNSETHYYQADLKKGSDYQKFTGEIIISKPVKPGSVYRIHYSKGTRKKGASVFRTPETKTLYEWDIPYSLQNNNFDLTMPAKPGLYYIGILDGKNSAFNDSLVMDKAASVDDEIKCLKEALKKYKGTAWEEVIQKRIMELKNEEY